MREKLIELLDVALFSINWDWGDIPNTGELADHLIANGVTIPVRCKDCKRSQMYRLFNEKEETLCCVDIEDGKFNTKIEAARSAAFSTKVVEMPKHDCPDDLLHEQQSVMGNYLHLLELRAEIEGVAL